MHLLIIGGTRFLGRALVEAALDAGHEVTLFNRGISNPDLFSHLEQLQGDRDKDLSALAGRRWDAVIDTCGYVPRQVKEATGALRDRVGLYAFISTISVYAEPYPPAIDEGSPLAMMADPHMEEITGESYGPLKALCEREAADGMDGRALLVRAGLLVGPHDPTDRFTYWPARVARGGEVLAPGRPDGPVQFVDVRDIAAWVVHATKEGLSGPYNVTGPAQPMTLEQLLQACHEGTGGSGMFTWVDEPFLVAQGLTPFVELPLWVPASEAGLMRVNIYKARRQGLAFRPLPETIKDTWEWSRTRDNDHAWRAGLAADREQALLRLWHASG